MNTLISTQMIGREFSRLSGACVVNCKTAYSVVDDLTYIELMFDENKVSVIKIDPLELSMSMNCFSDKYIKPLADTYKSQIEYLDGVSHI